MFCALNMLLFYATVKLHHARIQFGRTYTQNTLLSLRELTTLRSYICTIYFTFTFSFFFTTAAADVPRGGFHWVFACSLLRFVRSSVVVVDVVSQVTSQIFEPFEQYLEHTYNSHLDSMHRFNFALLTYVRDLFNFT